MNPLAVLLPALYAALTAPALTVAGVAIGVYQHLPEPESGHYVLIEQPTDTDAGGSAGCRHFSCTVLLDVVTQFPNQVTTTVAEALVTQINARLRGQRLVLPAGWDGGPGSLEPGLQVSETDGDLRAVRRLLRYRWEIYYHF